MKIGLVAIFLLALPIQLVADNYSGKSYVDATKSFLDIKDPHRQAEAWAMCAASYDVMAEILTSTAPARAKQLADLANGAELAVIISMIANKLDKDMSPEKFNSLWSFSKISGAELPKTRRTILLAKFESDKSEGAVVFVADVSKTVEVCAANLEAQQTYIDIWRELATSGLLQMPAE